MTLKKTTKQKGRGKREKESNREKLKNNQKTINKLAISTY